MSPAFTSGAATDGERSDLSVAPPSAESVSMAPASAAPPSRPAQLPPTTAPAQPQTATLNARLQTAFARSAPPPGAFLVTTAPANALRSAAPGAVLPTAAAAPIANGSAGYGQLMQGGAAPAAAAAAPSASAVTARAAPWFAAAASSAAAPAAAASSSSAAAPAAAASSPAVPNPRTAGSPLPPSNANLPQPVPPAAGPSPRAPPLQQASTPPPAVVGPSSVAPQCRSRSVFWWPSRSIACRLPAASTLEESSRINDRILVACQELDRHERRVHQLILDDLLEHPRADYEGEPFVAAVRRGELRADRRRGADPFADVLDFLRLHNAIPARGPDAAPPPPAPPAKRKEAPGGGPPHGKRPKRPRTMDAIRGISARRGREGRDEFDGRFGWRDKEITTQLRKSVEEAVRARDRLLIVCKWLDVKEGRRPAISDTLMNWPVSDYRGEPFFAALERGEFEADKDGDPHSSVYAFLRAHGEMPAPPSTRRLRQASSDAAKMSSGKVTRGLAAAAPWKGINPRGSEFEGRFAWRGDVFITQPLKSPEEAARARDRLIIVCKWLDEREGRRPAISEKAMNWPASEYRGESFFAALERGGFDADGEGDPHGAVREFLRAHGAAAVATAPARPPPRLPPPPPAPVKTAQKGVYQRGGEFEGQFAWRGNVVLTRLHKSAEEAALERDRLIIICKWLDQKVGRQPQFAISDDTMNRPASEYESEPFFTALERGEMTADGTEEDDKRDDVYAFLQEHSGSAEPAAAQQAPPKKRPRPTDEATAAQATKGKAAELPTGEAAATRVSKGKARVIPKAEPPVSASSRGGLRGTQRTFYRNKVRFRGSVVWRGSIISSPHMLTRDKAARYRDRLIIACQWLDDHSKPSIWKRIPNDKMNFPRADYQAEPFFKALQRGELQAAIARGDKADMRRIVRRFVGGESAPEEQAAPVEEAEEDEAEAEEAGREEAEEAGRDVDQRLDARGRRVHRHRFRTVPSPHTTGRKPRYSRSFSWRGVQFEAPPGPCSTAEEAARMHDRIVLACEHVDKLHGVQDAAGSLRLNFPEADYEREPFHGLLSTLRVSKAADARDAMRAIHAFLDKHCPRAASSSDRPAKAGQGEDAAAASSRGKAWGSRRSAEDSGAESSARGKARARQAPVKVEEGAVDGPEPAEISSRTRSRAREESGGGAVDWRLDPRLRWRTLLKHPRHCESIYVHQDRFVAGFYIQDEQVISPHFDTVDEAKRFVDRCRIAWCGPQGEAEHGMKLFFRVQDYRHEPFFRKLFTGPKRSRLPIGDNNPNWKDDLAAAVRETVQFVMDELGLVPTFGVPSDPPPLPAPRPLPAPSAQQEVEEEQEVEGDQQYTPEIVIEAPPPSPPSFGRGGSPRPPRPSDAVARRAPGDDAGPPPPVPSSSSSASPVPPAAAPPPAVEDPTTLLRWTPQQVTEWLQDVFTLDPAGPALRCLRRLELNGRALVLRPACALRGRLLRLQREEGADQDALESVLDSLDHEVALLVERARRSCGSEAAAVELQDRLEARRREEARLAKSKL